MNRCYAVVGTTWTGPMVCGHLAKSEDANGRPICGIHRDGQKDLPWDPTGSYPNGPQGTFRFQWGKGR